MERNSSSVRGAHYTRNPFRRKPLKAKKREFCLIAALSTEMVNFHAGIGKNLLCGQPRSGFGPSSR
jgi:hypothetical protein